MKKVLGVVLLIGSLAALWLLSGEKQEDKILDDVKPVEVMASKKPVTSRASTVTQAEVKKVEVAAKKQESAEEEELSPEEGFQKIHEKVSQLYKKKNSESELIEFFQVNGLEPQVSRDSNPYTGSMTMIRTQKGLKGSRYYHAQYFTDESGDSFLQHLSTEFRPGPQAFETVQALMEKTYGVKNGKLSRDGNFIQYKLIDNGVERVLWIKKMDQSDFDNALFNAYDPEKDMGTIQVALELEIHDSGREDADHMHPQGH